MIRLKNNDEVSNILKVLKAEENLWVKVPMTRCRNRVLALGDLLVQFSLELQTGQDAEQVWRQPEQNRTGRMLWARSVPGSGAQAGLRTTPADL